MAAKNADEKYKEAFQKWDYDAAITATGYGRYNVMLLLATVCPLVSSLFCTSTISYILPSAECDLNLTSFDKGLLNAVTYLGMIITGFFWGFLADTLGRQRLLVAGLTFDAIFNITAGLVTSYPALLFAKLLDGLVCGGPYAVVLTYLAECNPDKQRSQIVQLSGVITAIGTCALPLLAWVILPLENDSMLPSLLGMPSWRIFIVISAVPAIVAAITFFFRWESPKFLLSQGRDEEALECLRQMYVINTNNPGYTFPVASLKSVKQESVDPNRKASILEGIRQGFKQIAPLFRPPHLSSALLIFTFQFGALLGYNTIRLWMPQLFATVLDAERTEIEKVSTICDLVGPSDNNSTNLLICPAPPVDSTVYLNSIILGVITAIFFLFAGFVTRWISDKTLIVLATGMAVISCVAMYWGVTSDLLMVFSGLFIAATSISSTAILSVAILTFPTETRTLAVALTMMFGQIGGTVGNVLFPVLIEWSCTVPFFALAALLLGTGLLVFLIPKPAESTEK